MEEPKEYYEAHERVKIAMYSYELRNPEVEYLYATEYELEQGKVLIKFMRDKYNIVVIECFDWEPEYDKQIKISKFNIQHFKTFMKLFNEDKIIL